MSKKEKLIKKILFSINDKNIKFDELALLLKYLGFKVKIKGSHHIFSRKDIDYKPNIQKDGTKAKAYQVKQIRKMIVDFKLWQENE